MILRTRCERSAKVGLHGCARVHSPGRRRRSRVPRARDSTLESSYSWSCTTRSQTSQAAETEYPIAYEASHLSNLGHGSMHGSTHGKNGKYGPAQTRFAMAKGNTIFTRNTTVRSKSLISKSGDCPPPCPKTPTIAASASRQCVRLTVRVTSSEHTTMRRPQPLPALTGTYD